MSSSYPPYSGRCISCGVPLTPNVTTCMNCGAYNPPPQPGMTYGQPAGQPPSSSSMSWGTPPPPLPQNGQPYPGQPQYNQPGPIPGNTYGQSYPAQSSSFANQSYAAPGQSNTFNAYASQQPSTYYTPPVSPPFQPGSMNGFAPAGGGYAQTPQPKRGPNVGLIVGIVVLLVMLVGGGVFGVLYFKNQSASTTSVTPTPAITTPTVKPLFSDTFVNNNAGWDLTSTPGKFSVKVGSGSLILEDDDNKLLWEVVPGNSFSDFRLDVDATLSKGNANNGYGVFIRTSASQDSDVGLYYRFELYGDGSYAVFKGSANASGNSQSNNISDYHTNSAIRQVGQANHLTIIAKGTTMTFQVNGTTIYTYNDNSYKGGNIALFVSNLPNTPPVAQATFKNLAIYPVS